MSSTASFLSLGSENVKVEREREPLSEPLKALLDCTANSVASGSLKLNLPLACGAARFPPMPVDANGEDAAKDENCASPSSSYSEPCCRAAYTEDELKKRDDGVDLCKIVQPVHASQIQQEVTALSAPRSG